MDIRRDGQITYHNVNCKILAKGRNAFFCWVGYSKIRMLKQSGTVGQKLTITQNCNSKCYTCLCKLIYIYVYSIYILAKIINILYSKYTPYRIFLRIYTWICVFRLTTHKIFHSFCCFAICRSCHLLREIYRFLMQNHAWNVLMFQSDSNKDISVRFSCYILRHICILYLYYWIFYNRFYICFLRRQARNEA